MASCAERRGSHLGIWGMALSISVASFPLMYSVPTSRRPNFGNGSCRWCQTAPLSVNWSFTSPVPSGPGPEWQKQRESHYGR